MAVDWKDAPIGKFWWLVGHCAANNPHLRAGQTTFNVLAQVRPDLSEQIRATPLDAFHADGGKRLGAMCEWIDENWTAETPSVSNKEEIARLEEEILMCPNESYHTQ